MKDNLHSGFIYMNTEVLLPVHKTFLQVYNSTELAREQVLYDYNSGHMSESKYNAVICALNSHTVCIWQYTSLQTDSKIIGVCRDSSIVGQRVNMNALAVLYCDVFDHILKANKLKLVDIYDSHWLTYLSENIFMYLLPLYISDKYDFVLKNQFHTTYEYTVYNTNIITVLSVVGNDIKRDYPDYLTTLFKEEEVENFFGKESIQGICGRKESDASQFVGVKINTAPSPYGYIETMITLFHELNHTVATLLRLYEKRSSETQYEILYRQLITSYVYNVLISMDRTMWDITDKVVETPQLPDSSTQLLLPMESR